MKQGITNGCFMESVIEKAPGIGLDRDAVGFVPTSYMRCPPLTYLRYI